MLNDCQSNGTLQRDFTRSLVYKKNTRGDKDEKRSTWRRVNHLCICVLKKSQGKNKQTNKKNKRSSVWIRIIGNINLSSFLPRHLPYSDERKEEEDDDEEDEGEKRRDNKLAARWIHEATR